MTSHCEVTFVLGQTKHYSCSTAQHQITACWPCDWRSKFPLGVLNNTAPCWWHCSTLTFTSGYFIKNCWTVNNTNDKQLWKIAPSLFVYSFAYLLLVGSTICNWGVSNKFICTNKRGREMNLKLPDSCSPYYNRLQVLGTRCSLYKLHSVRSPSSES